MNIPQLPAEIQSAINLLLSPYGFNLSDIVNIKSESEKDNSKYLSVSEAEKYCHISRYSLYRAAKAQKIRTFKLSKSRSGKVLVLKSSIDSWLESCCQNVKRSKGGIEL